MKKINLNKMDVILVIIGVTLVVFTVRMIKLYEVTGSIPDTLVTAVFTVCGGECGIMGWIKNTNEKKRDRAWKLEDEAREKEEEK